MNNESFKPLRIAIVGSCQVVGIAAAARRMLPGANVKAWHVGVHPKDTDEDLLAVLPSFDLVISQISDFDGHISLRITRLRERGLPVFYLPIMVFPGFHPDIVYIQGPRGLVQGVAADYHSIIVAAAFSLGLPENRVPGLFNSYIFAGLGYFEVFDAAKIALIANFDQEGIDLRPLFDRWVRHGGQFMYTINHPHILVLAGICQLLLARAGHVDASAPLPENIDDYLATHFLWPVYPALAKRLGLSGSTMFLQNTQRLADTQPRELPLHDFVSSCFRTYRDLSADMLRSGAVAAACERLGSLIT